MSGDFEINHANDLKYEYDHRDGTAVKVSIDELRNGARVSAYHYDEDGSRMAYYPFRVSSVDARQMTFQRGDADQDQDPPKPVIAAIHSGGWEIQNVKRATFDVTPGDPTELQLLDVRDFCETASQEADGRIPTRLFNRMARIAQNAATIQGTFYHEAGERDEDAHIAENFRGENLELRERTPVDACELAADNALHTIIDHGSMNPDFGVWDDIESALNATREAFRSGDADTWDEAAELTELARYQQLQPTTYMSSAIKLQEADR